ncbi:MAG: pilus assembly protein [Rhodovulum sp.]|nr:hypothetical protein [Rhodovulum sp.]MCI5084560.1 pilus assembly protein [Rhodovulum sp.]
MSALIRITRAFWRDERGATLVELGMVMPAFLLLFFGIIDFGRLSFHVVTAEKALQIAARIAAVRPPACDGVAVINTVGVVPNGEIAPKYGTNCRAGSTVCAQPADVTCAGDETNDTVAEIWPLISGALPIGATAADLQFTYASDPNLGFLGGPFVPVLTVTLTNQTFTFVSPLGALAGMTGAADNPDLPAMSISFPDLSVSLPAEDLATGNTG